MKANRIILLYFLLIFAIHGNAQVSFEDGELYIVTRSTNAKRFFIAKDFNLSDSLSTHVGIGIAEKGELKIYHVEPDSAPGKSALSKVSLKDFTAVPGLASYSIWKDITSGNGALLKDTLKDWEDKKIAFDFEFNLANENLYCSEFVWMMLKTLQNPSYGFVPIEKELNDFYKKTLGSDKLIYIPVDFFIELKMFKKIYQPAPMQAYVSNRQTN